MSLSRPIQWYHSHADLIWPDDIRQMPLFTYYTVVIYPMARGLMQWAPLPEVGWPDLCHEAWGTDNHRHQHTWN
jgi:hypothetical protein